MKKVFLLFFLLGFAFCGSYLIGKGRLDFHSVPEGEKKEFSRSRFSPNPFPIQNHFFTIVIIGKDNGASVEKTLGSIFSQNYENYRVIYIDDASDDESQELASDLIYESKQSLRVSFIQNEAPLGYLANLVRAVDSCGDQEIVIAMDPGDWLAHEWVLQRLNSYYSNPDLWMAFSRFCQYPGFETEEPFSFDEKTIGTGLKSFYAALFKKIKKEDLYSADKLAFTVPLMEMASDHFCSIPEVLYVRDDLNVLENPETRNFCEQFIKRLPSYPKIRGSLFSFESNDEEIR